MDLCLRDKSVLVTGSSKGIGFAIANQFLDSGANVAFNSRNIQHLKAVLESLPSGRTIATHGDVSNPVQAKHVVDRVISEFGRIDILVCNVGCSQSVPPGKESYSEWNRIFALNLWSTTNVVEAATESLALSGGSIVCISSICGHETVPGAPVTYSVAKAALNAYVQGISRPLAKHGVRINAIAAGNILFNGSIWQKRLQEDPEDVHKMLASNVALARLGTAQEIANLALWLSSPLASFCTGSVFIADGGQVHS